MIPIWETGREEEVFRRKRNLLHANLKFFLPKEIEQYHMSISFPGIAVDSEDIYPVLVMNNLIGAA